MRDPFFVRCELVPHPDRATTEVGWGWRPFLFVAAHRSGYAVRHLEGDFACPPGKAEEDAAERAHRLQLSQNVAGLVLASRLWISS